MKIIKPADRNSHDDIRHGDDLDYIEYGVELPNGVIWWGSNMYPAPMAEFPGVDWERLDLLTYQEKAQLGYATHLERQGITYDPEVHKLKFIQRRQQIRFTAPEPLPGEDLPEFEPEGTVVS